MLTVCSSCNSACCGQYAVMILVLVLFPPRSNIHDQHPRFLNSWPVLIALHDTSSTVMIAVPPLLNHPPEMVTLLYPVLILLILNHPSFLLYILSFMGILLQWLFTSVSHIIDIPSSIIIFFKVSSVCWIDWYDAFPIPPMFWNIILILSYLSPPLSWWPQSPQRFLLGFVNVYFSIPLLRCPGGCG